jgi:membrane dipeptidase
MSSPLIIVDAHEDIAYNYLAFGRDYRESAYRKREREGDAPHLKHTGTATMGLPDGLIGRIAVVFATLFVAPRTPRNSPYAAVNYATPREAYIQTLRQWDYYQRLFDDEPRLLHLTTNAQLDAVIATWAEEQPLEQVQQGVVFLMEGADPILEPKQFEEWYERGVRIVGPAWSRTRYAGGTGEPGGLTAMGKELLEILAGYNVILDLSHLAEEAYLEAIERFQGEAIIASHSNPRRFCNTDRQLSDEMIRLLAERDGVMGIVPYNFFLSESWYAGRPRHELSLSRVLDAIDHICQMTGSARHVGIGSDFDGGFGLEDIPEEFDTIADLWKIRAGLHERGYAQDDIAAILGGNMIRKLRQVLS